MEYHVLIQPKLPPKQGLKRPWREKHVQPSDRKWIGSVPLKVLERSQGRRRGSRKKPWGDGGAAPKVPLGSPVLSAPAAPAERGGTLPPHRDSGSSVHLPMAQEELDAPGGAEDTFPAPGGGEDRLGLSLTLTLNPNPKP
mmetsp:Transcript_38/g.138  ORF Transcript_38/g.138 Transcript_38/m.138 type:complete len:140 (-) Transcript_38:20-439(-)